MTQFRIYLLLLAILMVPNFEANADSKPSPIPYLGVVKWVKDNILSKQSACVIDTILKTVQLEAYPDAIFFSEGNEGMTYHFKQTFSENVCFAVKAQDFWMENGKNDNNIIDMKKVTLDANSGEGKFKDLKPGWLMKKALAATNGDPNAAVTLLGACMNDDIVMGNDVKLKGEAAAFAVRKKIAANKAKMQSLRSLLYRRDADSGWSSSKEMVEFDIQDLSDQNVRIEQKFQKSKEYILNIPCPRKTNRVFLGKAIDSSFETPKSLQKDLIDLQGDNHIAKNYHFAASMYTGCQLAQCGISPDKATQVASLMAKAYRSVRLCASMKPLKGLRDSIVGRYGLNPDSPNFRQEAQEIAGDQPLELLSLTPEELEAYKTEKDKLKKMNVIASNPMIYSGFTDWDRLEKEAKKKKNDQLLSKLDATYLYERSYLGSIDSGTCTWIGGGRSASEIAAPDWHQQEKTPFGTTTLNASSNSCNIVGWSIERCKNARRRLASWDVDFEWTSKQHEIGAKFGATFCKKLKPDETLDKLVCGGGPATGKNGANKDGTK